MNMVSGCVPENEATIMPISEAPYPSGKGAVCKTAMQRFEPARRLQTALCAYRSLSIVLSILMRADKPLQCLLSADATLLFLRYAWNRRKLTSLW
jgi:hypothetical protein